MLSQEQGEGWLLSEANLHPKLQLSSSHLLDLFQSAAKRGHKWQKALKSNHERDQNKIQECYSS